MIHLAAVRFFATALIAVSLVSLECRAQAPGQDVQVTAEKARAAAKVLSDRAIKEVRDLDFKPYLGERGVLIAEGDSWFDYPFYDVLQNLEGLFDYKVESTAHKGDTLESMVYDLQQLSSLALKMSRLASAKKKPVAILLSGGGNDIAGPELSILLNHAKSNLPQPLNESIVVGVFDVRLRMSYLTLIQAVTDLSIKYFDVPLPVLIHGYDYPVPDGRGFLGGGGFLPGPWFKPYFEAKGYSDIQKNAETLRTLVDRFNAVLASIPKENGYKHVCYVQVTGTLSAELSGPRPYDRDWGNELHPTRSGFREVARKFQKTLLDCAGVK